MRVDNEQVNTVLVVDDEPSVRDVVVRYLRREGYSTLEAANGDIAREMLETQTPSLVVLDLMLPGMDGLSLCRWIRERSELPVIMITALGEETDRLLAFVTLYEAMGGGWSQTASQNVSFLTPAAAKP